jgi:hypothetical protein
VPVEIINDLNYDDELSQLCSKYCLDKGMGNYPTPTFGNVPPVLIPHGYSKFYHKYLHREKENITSVLEIGVRYGNSLLMWDEYFPNAQVYGFDIDEKSIIKEAKHFNITIGDQNNRNDLDRLIKNTQNSFDLIIEDGGHDVISQQMNLGYMFKHVKPGGYYIVEDIHTSLGEFERWKISRDRSNTMLRLLESFYITHKMNSQYIMQEEIKYLEDNIEFCVTSYTRNNDFYDPMGRNPESPSITAIIKKR